MPKIKDILAKAWLRRGSEGILSRRLCGGTITEHLPTDQPQINSRQADALIRNDKGTLHHIEFQATNETDFSFRMLEYYVYLYRRYREPIHQTVFYIGQDPLRLQDRFEDSSTTHNFEIVNLHDYNSADLLASPDWGDNLWALGATGDRNLVLRQVLLKLVQIEDPEQRATALAELTAFSGILKLDEPLQQNLKEFPVLDIDLRQNAVIRPLLEEAEAQGRNQGRSEGREEGMEAGLKEGLREGSQARLLEQLEVKFGALPSSAIDRVHNASLEQIKLWARRILSASLIEETLL